MHLHSNVQSLAPTLRPPLLLYDVENFETRAKRAGKDGEFIMHNGMYIYVRTSVVAGEAKHSIFENTTRKPVEGTASDAIADALNG